LLLLKTLTLTERHESYPARKRVLAFVIVTITGSLLVYGTWDMPEFGGALAVAHQHVASRYLEMSVLETGSPNVVTAILASYRGFDTLGELIVIFTAGIGVLVLLESRDQRASAQAAQPAMQQHLVLRIVAKVLIPMIMLFALYVQFHGEYGPGGGFQAGVIFAAAVILYAILFGAQAVRRVYDARMMRILAALGVLLFGGLGIVGLLTGGTFLEYTTLAANPITAQRIGILLAELGVGITVAAVLIFIFCEFDEHTPTSHEESH
jgi:multicomponent Na+:H+ antiporter subunit B